MQVICKGSCKCFGLNLVQLVRALDRAKCGAKIIGTFSVFKTCQNRCRPLLVALVQQPQIQQPFARIVDDI